MDTGIRNTVQEYGPTLCSPHKTNAIVREGSRVVGRTRKLYTKFQSQSEFFSQYIASCFSFRYKYIEYVVDLLGIYDQ